jgi:hypothetical protein
MRLFGLAVAALLFLFVATLPASAQAPVAGTRNFEPPTSVPNYFSNEAGPFRGGAGAETTYSSSGPALASPYPPVQTAAAPRRTVSRHVAHVNRHLRFAHAHSRSGRHAARTRIAKAKAAVSRIAHAHARPAAGKKGATKLASAKKPGATKAAASKKQPASVKSRPGKEKRATHTAAR